jgi:hypothetical protein
MEITTDDITDTEFDVNPKIRVTKTADDTRC